ncbi:hypothetical protein C8A00DRAFT_36440 [Chaetomidium leptoderma]|uniref:Uncharacterized protein n=1 Tax=Chaetomidium leptoderma TaxID=669021 RepID=A0AAN6VHI0_9PEZI|nr:hypothetical protein C8A00DRAFT_36440 [Chaetomidium leptoderma]
MDAIAESLSPLQKAKLHQVADLMLEIYQTLARMRYLEAEWIQRPPQHDLSALLPLFTSLALDPRVIYLYSILPYLSLNHPRGSFSSEFDFFGGAAFADFRHEADVRAARESFDPSGDDPGCELRPWITPLAGKGMYHRTLVYDAKRHVMAIFCDQDGGNMDPNLDSVTEWGEEEEWEEEEEEEDEEEEGDEEEEEENDDDDDEDEDEVEQENYWDEMGARPAGNVLRDIIRWYHELVEIPGGDHGGWEWSEEIVKPLYRKHGWPGENFDGDAFLVDQACAVTAAAVRDSAKEMLRRLKSQKDQLEEHEKDKASTTSQRALDEEWEAERRTRELKHWVRLAEVDWRRTCRKPEDLPLWELEDAQRKLGWEKDRLESSKQQEEVGEEWIRYAEKRVATHEKAYAACLANAERLCPGRPPLSLDPGTETGGPSFAGAIECYTEGLEFAEQEVAYARDWIAQLPESEGAEKARKLAQDHIDKCEEDVVDNRNRMELCIKEMERRKGGG